MRKNNIKRSQQGIKRYNKNIARKARKKHKLENHIIWLENVINAGVELDFERLWKKKDGLYRNPKDIKYIIDKLVSRNVPIYKKAKANGRV